HGRRDGLLVHSLNAKMQRPGSDPGPFAFFSVIPGRRAAANPESSHTCRMWAGFLVRLLRKRPGMTVNVMLEFGWRDCFAWPKKRNDHPKWRAFIRRRHHESGRRVMARHHHLQMTL